MSAIENVDRLFDEFIDARNRGERPDVSLFLERAGPNREVLGRLIDVYLVNAPVMPPDEETVILLSAQLARRSPMSELRQRRDLALGVVVDRLRDALGLSASLDPRIREAYEDLERDWLDPRRVQAPVWAALKSIFDMDVRRLFPADTSPPVAAVLMRRDASVEAVAATPHEHRPGDEVDELFRGLVSDA